MKYLTIPLRPLCLLLVAVFLYPVGALLLPSCAAPQPTATGTSLVFANTTNKATMLYAAFGADSITRPSDWPFCAASSALTCNFVLSANEEKAVSSLKYTNVTVSFDAPVGCGATKAELNLSNPHWFDVVDISLVDGFNRKIKIVADGTPLGPVLAQDGNAELFGVYPYGCDTCAARTNPPCGIAPGKEGCKAGTQFNPTPACQWQGARKGGGGLVRVELQ